MELGFKEGIAASFCLSAQVALNMGEIASARTLVEQSLALYTEIEHRHGIAEALLAAGRVAAAEGNYAEARTHYEKGLALAREIGDRLYIASYLEGLATVVAKQGDLAWAVRLWGAAASLRDIISAPIPPIDHAAYERSLDAARMQLREQAFATLWAEGQTMTPEQVIGPQGQAAIPALISTVASATMPSSPLPAKPPVTYPDGLTAREVEVLRLVAKGFTDAQVAEQLVISPRTVNAHLTSIYGKIQATSRASATRYAIEHHLA
jgi:ATP/maltotriose-dependent transcriptional regulator MalT